MLVVGLVFGVFHVALFRILPTAFLGAMLTGVVLLTGSILPAIAWHFAHNSLGVLIDRYGWGETWDPAWVSYGAVGLLAASIALIWYSRTPYPKPGPTVSGA